MAISLKAIYISQSTLKVKR